MTVTPPPTSALQNLILKHSARSSLQPAQASADTETHWSLALQIAHNLRYQHNWTSVRIHSLVPDASAGALRPVLSGLPPQRLYVHPDEQIEFLQRQAKSPDKQASTPESKLSPEREWVLPSQLREKWSLRRLATVFDALDKVPSRLEGELLFDDEAVDNLNYEDAGTKNPWRIGQPKRLLLAILDDDSTVVYYIMHDGIVKPRQN